MEENASVHSIVKPQLAATLPASGANGRARAAALPRFHAGEAQPTALVSYASAGALLVIGPASRACEAAGALRGRLDCAVVITDAGSDTSEAERLDGMPVVRLGAGRAITRLEGHLGNFQGFVQTCDGEVSLARVLGRQRPAFDLVLDMSPTPLIGYEVPPPGYYAPGADATRLAAALGELPELVGELEKPQYFQYNPDICAHGSSGLTGCTRCLQACPTGAIASIGELIEVDPYLCQGAGSCATACPTGAITYAYPRASDLLAAVKAVLKTYADAGGDQPCLLFCDRETGVEVIERLGARLPEHVLPLEVEEIGAVGMEAWLTSLAYGASHVGLLATEHTPGKVLGEVRHQLECAQAVLSGMGFAAGRLALLGPGVDDDHVARLSELAMQPIIARASFATYDKRTTLRMALDHLYAQAPSPASPVTLPDGAPFGEIQVDRDACTLCMACTSVCPASAVIAGGETPKLKFIEWNCVQCGLCETACPEDAIRLAPRMVFEPETRERARTLNEEAPFCCVSCGKPFATQSLMDKMTAKLKNHWMFQDGEALRRIQMCENCRVADMFSADAPPDVYNKPKAH